eukprot:TRINITY_DN10670_c0_g1_i1.p1 TRINITY_DN10670_c0_g1~~TRINITY_DN10670_c0_g1_i1.p1  ORF type:complete len:451 (+),score=55.10 TRINITY_DN10670_c0_g1_i1:69-1421(+)
MFVKQWLICSLAWTRTWADSHVNVSVRAGPDICNSLHSTQCWGSDIKNIGKVYTHEACCQACQQTPGCNAWTWNWKYGKACYLKKDCSDRRTLYECHSGIGGGPPTPTPPPSPVPPPSPGPGLYINPLNIKPNAKRSDNFFLLLGDYGTPDYHTGHCQKKIGKMMQDYVRKQSGKKALFVGALGDNFYDKGLKDDNHWRKQWSDVYGTNDPSSPLHNVPWLAVMGNHDLGNDDWGCGCNKGCKHFNGAHRPSGTDKFWIPGYYWSYYIPGVDLEVIGIDTNAVDVDGLGGNGWGGGARTTYNNCGGHDSVKGFLNDMKGKGEQLLDERAAKTTAKTALIMQHYNYPNLGQQYKDRFNSHNGGRTRVLSAFGHQHKQECWSSNHNACDVILSGGGAGWIDRDSYRIGFVAVHLTDDGGFTTDIYSNEVTLNGPNSCGGWLSEEEGNVSITV